MAKLTAWVVTILGVVLLLPLIGVVSPEQVIGGFIHWLIAIGVLVIGIGKLIRNYSSSKK